MTGKAGAATWMKTVGPQPGGRAPAPGRLALLQSFINSHYDLEREHGRDLLDSPPALAAWLTRHGLQTTRHPRLTEQDRLRAVAVREGLRELARANGVNARAQPDPEALSSLNAAAERAAVEFRFDRAGRPHLTPTARASLNRALGDVLAIAAVSIIEGTWEHLKICPGEDCGWAFYDHSRNQSGRWCSMSVCGGRAKVRAHYRRTRAITAGRG
jgi:predicted RNA-binding Zn ribbon-like protein